MWQGVAPLILFSKFKTNFMTAGDTTMNNRISGIYYIKNTINNKLYVGQSIDVYARLSRHKTDLRGGRDSKHLQKSYDKYGEDNFEFTMFMECPVEDLDYWEKYYIEKWNTQDENFGYNLDGGGSKSRLMSEETKLLISQALIGHVVSEETKNKIRENHADFSGVNNPNFGKLRSEEACEKSRQSNRKAWSDPELRIKHSLIKTGQGTKKYYSPQLDMEFDGLQQAMDYVGIKSKTKISDCIYGRRKSAGKHPITGEKLTWVILENK